MAAASKTRGKSRGEAERYLDNARTFLRKVPVEEETYLDIKPVREAFGTAYLGVLEAINAALFRKGLNRKELPRSVDGYRNALKKYMIVHDGKLFREFEKLYDALHIAGYYRGLMIRLWLKMPLRLLRDS